MTFEEILDQAMAMLQRRGRVTYQTLKLQFQLDEETRGGTIVGGLRATGLRPKFLQKFEKRGVGLPLGLFQAPEAEFGAAAAAGTGR